MIRRVLVIAAATALLPVLFAATAGATTSHHRLWAYSFIWKPGTALPHVPAGYKLVAWPPQQVLAKLKPGQTVPVRTVNAASPGSVRAASAMTNPAGLVNMELAPADCGNPNFLSDLGSRPTTVIQSYSTIKGAKQSPEYGNNQSSSLEVGESVSGSKGTFTGGGTWSISDGDTQGFKPQKGRSFNYFQTYFEQGKYFVLCHYSDSYYETKAYKWNAGTNYVHPKTAPSVRRANCTPEHPGDYYIKSHTAASVISAGFTIPLIGFTGTAQTGYSATAAIRFDFYQNGHLCGKNNTPPNNPGFLVATS